MKKNTVKIYNKYRDSVIPFFKGSAFIFALCGAITTIFNPVVGLCQIGAGFVVAGYCVYEDIRLSRKEKQARQQVKELLVEEYKEEQKEAQKQDTTEKEEIKESKTNKTQKEVDIER